VSFVYPTSTGALLVLAIHVIVVRSFRRVTSQAFYRKLPATANVTVLVRECGLVALTQGFVIVRILKLLLTAVLYAGRVDTPFLYDSCGQIGGFRIDREPYMFQIDILQHEAHRHPYIETLGVMYLSKLRHGDKFCTFAGSCWRLIFVYVLMPWLSKYRAMRRPQPQLLEGDVEEVAKVGTTPSPPPLRAVSLVDPQAYALRAVSLCPVASGWAGDSSMSFLGPSRSRRSALSLIEDQDDEAAEEEIRELRDEVRRLKMQLRLKDLDQAPENQGRFDPTVPKPGWEDDYEDVGRPPQPHSVDRDDMVDIKYTPPPSTSILGRIHETDTYESSPRTPPLRREKSAGLPTLRPPKGGHQVSWVDGGE